MQNPDVFFIDETPLLNISPVFPGIGVASLSRAMDPELLHRDNYQAILNVSEMSFAEEVRGIVKTYRWIQLDDGCDCDPERFIEAVDTLHELREGNLNTVVNCYAGMSRSASVVAAYLVRHRREELLAAWEQVRNCPLPGLFMFQHPYLTDPGAGADEGLYPRILEDPVFQMITTAFRVLAMNRSCVYIRPAMWRELFPKIRSYLMGNGHGTAM